MKQYSLARGANIAYKSDQVEQATEPEPEPEPKPSIGIKPSQRIVDVSEAVPRKTQSSYKMKTIIMPSGEIIRAKAST